MLEQGTKGNAGSVRERALCVRWRLHHVLRSGSHCKKHQRQYRRRFHVHSSSPNWLILLSNRQEEVFVLRNCRDRPFAVLTAAEVQRLSRRTFSPVDSLGIVEQLVIALVR